jgi:hypothetical protein
VIGKPGIQPDDPARLIQDVSLRQLTFEVVDMLRQHIVVRAGLHFLLLSLQASVDFFSVGVWPTAGLSGQVVDDLLLISGCGILLLK